MSSAEISKKSVIGAAIGTFIEYYEYSLFALFLPIISPLFFPADTAYQSMLKGYTVLFIAMLARPLGGLFFGHIGDMRSRRKALVASMYGIALSTIAIGLTPSYLTIGLWSMIIVILAKSVQLFCFGGEYNGAGTYIVELAKNKNEGFWGSLLSATVLVGAVIAALMGVIVTSAHLPDWSWRAAFVLGGLFGFWGISYRKEMIESPSFKPGNSEKHALRKMFKLFPKELTAGVFIGGFSTLPVTTILTFINPILMTKGLLTHQQFMLIQLLLTVIGLITILIAGKIADKLTPGRVMLFGCVLLTALSYPLMQVVDHGNMLKIIGIEIVLVVINELLFGPSNAFMKNLYPAQYRYRATSFSFCLGISLIGGLTPIVEYYLYQKSGHFSTAALWPTLIGIWTYFIINACHPSYGMEIIDDALESGG